MKKSAFWVMATGASLLAASAHGEYLVRLKSGNVLRAERTWTEGETLKVQFRTGVASFPSDAVEKIERVPDRIPAAVAARPPSEPAPAPAVAPVAKAEKAETKGKPADGRAASDTASPTNAVDAVVPQVAGEDARTRMERLDGLSMQTHRLLSIARRQNQPADAVKALEDRIDEINRQRAATMQKLK
jgi:hypothetical protein